MEIVLLLIGLLFFGIGVVVIRSARISEATGRRVEGEVIGYVPRRGSKGSSSWAPVVSFRHATAGRSIFESGMAGGVSYAIGEKVRVLLTPDEPVRARLDSKAPFWVGGVVAAIGAGLVVLFFSIFRWNLGSIGLSTLVAGVIAYQLWKRKAAMPKAGSLARSLRSATTAEVFAESAYDRSKLAPLPQIDAIRRRQPRQSMTVGVVLAVLAAGGFTGSWFWYQKRVAFLDHALSAQGEVVEMVASRGSKSTTWAPIIEFTPKDDWNSVRFRHSVSSSPPSYSVGDRVAVLYDPDRPQNAMIDSGVWNRVTPLIPGTVGALLLLLGYASFRSGLRIKRQYEEKETGRMAGLLH